MGEINTRGFIRSIDSNFPSGNNDECLSKTQIIRANIVDVNGNYGDNECPMIDDISCFTILSKRGYIVTNALNSNLGNATKVDFSWEQYRKEGNIEIMWRKNDFGDTNYIVFDENGKAENCDSLSIIVLIDEYGKIVKFISGQIKYALYYNDITSCNISGRLQNKKLNADISFIFYNKRDLMIQTRSVYFRC